MRCEDCKKAEGIINFSNEPTITITHGWGGIMICRKCFIKRIKSHIQDCKEQLNQQKRLLMLRDLEKSKGGATG